MIGTDFQDRNNGSDQDSDSGYTTDQADIVEHARLCYINYPTIVNNIPKDKNIYSKSDGIIAPKTTAIPNIKAEQFANENEYEFYYGYSGNLITPKGFLVATITGKFYKKKTTEEE